MRRLAAFSPFVEPPVNTLHLELRTATARQHQDLDAALAGALDDRRGYTRYLLGMLALVELLAAAPAAVDARAAWSEWVDPRRQALLRQDLRDLGLLPLAHGLAPLPGSCWMGANYVLEGSALGARVLLRAAERLRLREPGLPLAFLQHHARPGDRWPRFVDELQTLEGGLRADAVRGARHAFDVVADGLIEKESA